LLPAAPVARVPGMPAAKQRLFALRWFLPVAQLFLCMFVLLPELPFLGFQIQSAATAYWPYHTSEANTPPAPVMRVVDPAIVPIVPNVKLQEARIALPALINLPGFFIGASAWTPRGILPSYWRAMIFPLVGMIFWFVAGRGLEGLRAAQRRTRFPTITWVEFGASVFIIVACAMLCVGMSVDASLRQELVVPWPAAFVSSAVWIALGSAAVTGRIMQWRTTKRESSG
jgi:hypothetical protein